MYKYIHILHKHFSGSVESNVYINYVILTVTCNDSIINIKCRVIHKIIGKCIEINHLCIEDF